MHPRRVLAFIAVVLACAAPPACAQLVPLGPEFRINTTGLQATAPPVLALDGAGLLLAAWEAPGIQTDVLVRVFRRNGEPAGPETSIHAQGKPRSPAAVALAPGRFAVAWEDAATGALALRLFDGVGSPLGDEVRIDSGTDPASGVQIAARPSGGLLATWIDRGLSGNHLWARFFDAEGKPAGDAKAIALFASNFAGYLANEAVGVLDDGSFLAFWSSTVMVGLPFFPTRAGGHFDAAGEPLGPPFNVEAGLLAIGGDGFSLAWSWSVPVPGMPLAGGRDTHVSRFDASGHPLGSSTVIAGGDGNQTEHGVAIDDAGRTLVVWSERPFFNPSSDGLLHASLFNSEAVYAAGSEVTVSPVHKPAQVRIVGKNGDWALGWAADAGTPEAGNLFVRQLTTCATDGPRLCLAGRFQAQVTWRVPGIGIGTGPGHAFPLTGDTGAFWFFSPDNLELVVKALDGRPINGNYWIFYGALSDVEYDLQVHDVVTDARRVYHNRAGTLASRADTRAFAVPAGSPAVAEARTAPAAVRQQAEPLSPPPCFPGPENLCLGSPFSQFEVRTTWKVPGTGETGAGKAVQLTQETGYFWFFDPANVELMLKILDGQAINGKHWVFYGALSDVEYTITVTDKLSGKSKTYHNPAGKLASRADTSAF